MCSHRRHERRERRDQPAFAIARNFYLSINNQSIYLSIRLCENLPYIGSILREFEIIPYYGHTYA